MIGATFQIHARQMAVLDRAMDARFVERLIDALHSEELTEGDRSAMRSAYREWIAEARHFDLATEYELSVYVACCERFGAEFAKQEGSEPARIVANMRWSAPARAERLAVLCAG